jgi:hypothetical protein
MSHLAEFIQELYELRFSPMAKPAGEVSNLTQLESHTTRARVMMMWREVKQMVSWEDPRCVELIYQSTLDSISEAFDLLHYPVSQYMLAARADIWEAGLAPAVAKEAVTISEAATSPPPAETTETLLLAGELAQLEGDAFRQVVGAALGKAGAPVTVWFTATGASPYSMGARDVARNQAEQVIAGIRATGVESVIADGPETAWALTKIYPALGLSLPDNVSVKLLSTVLDSAVSQTEAPESVPSVTSRRVMIHDSRPACLIGSTMASNLAVMPGYLEDEAEFGQGEVYDAPRRLVDTLGGQRVFGTWTRSLAKSSGADDGLFYTYPRLAAGLARQRLDYAARFGVSTIVTDSPLAAWYLSKHLDDRPLEVKWLPELVI